MTPDDFKAWRKSLGWIQKEAADALGVSKSTVVNYEAGVRRDSGEAVEIPRSIGLACSALAAGLEEWKA